MDPMPCAGQRGWILDKQVDDKPGVKPRSLMNLLVDAVVQSAKRVQAWPMTFVEVSVALSSMESNPDGMPSFIAAILADSNCKKCRALPAAEALSWVKTSSHPAAAVAEEMILAATSVEGQREEEAAPVLYLVPPKAKSTEIDAILLEILTAHAKRLDAWLDATLREKLALRVENEDLHEVLADMQTVLASIKDTRSLVFEVAPTAAVREIGHSAISQRLPCTARGICDVELYCTDVKAPSLNSKLKVELLEHETDRVLHEWNLDSSELIHGWNRFTISRALACRRFDASLRLTASEPGIALALGEETVVAKAAVQPEGDNASRPVAFKVWQALPGSVQVRPATAPSGNLVGEWTGFLPSIYNSFRLALPKQTAATFPLFFADTSYLMLHPWSDMVSIANAFVTIPPRTTSLRITVTLHDKRSQDVEVVAGFLADRREDIVDPAEISSAPFFSDWQTLKAGDSSKIDLRLSGGSMHGLLFFAVRMRDPAFGSDFSATGWDTLELMRMSALID